MEGGGCEGGGHGSTGLPVLHGKETYMSRLIDVESQYLDALEWIMAADENSEEIPPEALEHFNAASLAVSEKREAMLHFLAFVEGREEYLGAREAELAKQRRSITRARERLESYLLDVMRAKGITTACAATRKFTVTESESVEVDNPDALPDSLCRFKREPDKKAVKLALIGEGVPIDPAAGARVVSKAHLRVKPLAVKDRPGDTLYAAPELVR